jgi:rhodanese-related sulfurtransferase
MFCCNGFDTAKLQEWHEGHIKGAVQIPSGTFQNEELVDDMVDSLVSQHKDAGTYVFHCMMSIKRGPTCAAIFEERLKKLNLEGAKVMVLQGGIQEFKSVAPDRMENGC